MVSEAKSYDGENFYGGSDTLLYGYGQGSCSDGYRNVLFERSLSCELTARNKEKFANLCKGEGLSDLKYLVDSAIPIPQLLEVVNFLPYGNPVRVCIMFNFLTGCRMSEANKMREGGKDSFLRGQWIYWRVGKNQHGQWRREWLPDYWIKEWLYYKQTHRVYDDFLFSIKDVTLRRYFNREVRPYLSTLWREKSFKPKKNGINDYMLQLKGTRKTFVTLDYANNLIKTKGSVTGSLVLTSKRLCHSTTEMTAHHYLREFKALEIEKWQGMTPSEILALADQKHIPEYDVKLNYQRINKENKQLKLQDF